MTLQKKWASLSSILYDERKLTHVLLSINRPCLFPFYEGSSHNMETGGRRGDEWWIERMTVEKGAIPWLMSGLPLRACATYRCCWCCWCRLVLKSLLSLLSLSSWWMPSMDKWPDAVASWSSRIQLMLRTWRCGKAQSNTCLSWIHKSQGGGGVGVGGKEGWRKGLISSLSRIKTFFLFKASNNDAIRGCFVDGCVRHGFFPNGESASLLCWLCRGRCASIGGKKCDEHGTRPRGGPPFTHRHSRAEPKSHQGVFDCVTVYLAGGWSVILYLYDHNPSKLYCPHDEWHPLLFMFVIHWRDPITKKTKKTVTKHRLGESQLEKSC